MRSHLQIPNQVGRVPRSGRLAVSLLIISLGIAGATGPSMPAVATTVNNGCIQDTAGFKLNCNSNDVSVAGIARDFEGKPKLTILDDGCAYPGDTVDFTATFDVVLTAQARYDIGIYFARDGGGPDGALTGSCSITTLDAGNVDAFNYVELDAAPDTCGDIDASHSPLQPTITVEGVQCIDSNNDGLLDFPNCVSWRQPGSNEVCTQPDQAFPGAPSKCRCDSGFTVPIDVPPASIMVTKTPSRESVNEPGGNVTYTVSVKNMGIDPSNPFTLQYLSDDRFGNLHNKGTCSVPQTIAQGGTYSCEFTAFVAGNVSDSPHVNEITASGIDSRMNALSSSGSASVKILNVQPTIAVQKDASPTQVLEPGGNVTYTVSVTNTSPASTDPIQITHLVDDKFGNLGGAGNCDGAGNPYPTSLSRGSAYTCQFVRFIGGNAGFVHTNIVEANAVDDDNTPIKASDDATVNVNNSPSHIVVTKTPSPAALPEPGGLVTYAVSVFNGSPVDAVTISSLWDDKFGDLNGQGSCAVPQTIAKSGVYNCSFAEQLLGFMGGEQHVNTVTASGVDDDGEAVTDSDGATVNFTDVTPAATLTKSVKNVLATFEVTVTNDKAAEELYLSGLNDSEFGDVADSYNAKLRSTTCSAPQTLAPKGKPGDSYTCTFEAVVTTSPHQNTLTGELSDDEGTLIHPQDTAAITFTK